ncbi:hypothetical protein B5M47_01235 [candidate division CPR3 bacterium 4484_211]|uniref:Excinuclease ABC subunit C n=1 Tax=candidate division CPR3 bacterium 4484_211 TaxID=1968527 RepID=A0A1W9NZ87_UNCC3|nr:MAG: hypothetical protein B5M47_01235 [candidate division CPR3 bacterium 4484_211]
MEFPQNVPTTPGIYIFRGVKKRPLYIGKAKNLKNRIRSYFQTKVGPKIRQMLAKAKDIKFVATDTELEAVLLEADLIKRLNPKYNTQWKDDKNFKYIALDFPRVYTTRKKSVPHAVYFGPFPDGKIVSQVLKTLRKIFPFRDCTRTKFNRHQKIKRPCLYYNLNLCPGPCIGAVSAQKYTENINRLILFLKGKKKKIIRDLKAKMKSASANKNFEAAAKYRDQIERLNYVLLQFRYQENYLKTADLLVDQKARELEELDKVLTGVLPRRGRTSNYHRFRLEAYDISNLQGQQATGSMAVLEGGTPKKSDYRKFKIRAAGKVDDVGMIKEVLKRRFSNFKKRPKEHSKKHRLDLSFSQAPHLILIDGGKPQLNAALQVLSQLKINLPAISLAKKEEIVYCQIKGKLEEIKLPKDSAALHLLQRARDEAHRFALTYHHKLRSRSLTHL